MFLKNVRFYLYTQIAICLSALFLSGCATPQSIVNNVKAQSVLGSETLLIAADELPESRKLTVGIVLLTPGVDVVALEQELAAEAGPVPEPAPIPGDPASVPAAETPAPEGAPAGTAEAALVSRAADESSATPSAPPTPAPAAVAASTSSPAPAAAPARPAVPVAAAKKKEPNENTVHPAIRRAEMHFMPYSLKLVLDRSKQWKETKVTPVPSLAVDLTVKGEIIASNGHGVALKLTAVDSSGREWLNEALKCETNENDYNDTKRLEKDPYDRVYSAVANRLARFRETLTEADIEHLRRLTTVRYAADLVPVAYSSYIGPGKVAGRLELLRLPAEGDPQFGRVTMVHTQELQLLSKIEQYYGGLHEGIWDPYGAWRAQVRKLAIQIAQARANATNQKTKGIALGVLGAMAAAYGANQGVNTNDLMTQSLQVMESSWRAAREITDLANSQAQEVGRISGELGGFLKPTIFELEGRTYELSGDAEKQFRSFRQIMRDLYLQETGTPPAPVSS